MSTSWWGSSSSESKPSGGSTSVRSWQINLRNILDWVLWESDNGKVARDDANIFDHGLSGSGCYADLRTTALKIYENIEN